MKSLKSYIILVIIPLFFHFTISPFNVSEKNPRITSGEVLEHIKYLSSDELAGRFPGTEGDRLAENYIIKELEEYGVKPAGDNGYLQPFEYTSEVKLGNG